MIDSIIMNIKDTLQTYTPNLILSKYQFKLINEGLKYYQELFKDSLLEFNYQFNIDKLRFYCYDIKYNLTVLKNIKEDKTLSDDKINELITDLFTRHLDINIHFKHYQNNNVFNYIKHLITFNLAIQLDTVKKYLIHVFNYFNDYNLSTNDNRSFYDYGFNGDEFRILFSYIKNNMSYNELLLIINFVDKVLPNTYDLDDNYKLNKQLHYGNKITKYYHNSNDKVILDAFNNIKRFEDKYSFVKDELEFKIKSQYQLHLNRFIGLFDYLRTYPNKFSHKLTDGDLIDLMKEQRYYPVSHMQNRMNNKLFEYFNIHHLSQIPDFKIINKCKLKINLLSLYTYHFDYLFNSMLTKTIIKHIPTHQYNLISNYLFFMCLFISDKFKVINKPLTKNNIDNEVDYYLKHKQGGMYLHLNDLKPDIMVYTVNNKDKNNITIWNKANKILLNICYELISKFKDYPIRFKVGLFVFGVNEKVNGFDEKFYNDIEQMIIKDLKTVPLFDIFNSILNLQYFDNKINKNITFTNAFCKFIIDNFYQQMDIYNNLFIKSLKTFKDSILSQNIKIHYKNPFYVLSSLNRNLIKINNNIMEIERLISTNANIDYTNEHDSNAITLFIKLDLTKDKMAYNGYNSNSIYENEIIIKPGRFRIINKLNKFVYEIEPIDNKI